VQRGPPTSVGFDAPDQGADQKPKLLGGDQPNIFPLDLNISLNFRLNFTLLSFTIPSQISA
jgi:hypothetical protein